MNVKYVAKQTGKLLFVLVVAFLLSFGLVGFLMTRARGAEPAQAPPVDTQEAPIHGKYLTSLKTPAQCPTCDGAPTPHQPGQVLRTEPAQAPRSERGVRTSDCTPACDCGCNEGLGCTCARGRVPARTNGGINLPTYSQPPAHQQFVPFVPYSGAGSVCVGSS
jgi:hypothetical protein